MLLKVGGKTLNRIVRAKTHLADGEASDGGSGCWNVTSRSIFSCPLISFPYPAPSAQDNQGNLLRNLLHVQYSGKRQFHVTIAQVPIVQRLGESGNVTGNLATLVGTSVQNASECRR